MKSMYLNIMKYSQHKQIRCMKGNICEYLQILLFYLLCYFTLVWKPFFLLAKINVWVCVLYFPTPKHKTMNQNTKKKWNPFKEHFYKSKDLLFPVVDMINNTVAVNNLVSKMSSRWISSKNKHILDRENQTR